MMPLSFMTCCCCCASLFCDDEDEEMEEEDERSFVFGGDEGTAKLYEVNGQKVQSNDFLFRLFSHPDPQSSASEQQLSQKSLLMVMIGHTVIHFITPISWTKSTAATKWEIKLHLRNNYKRLLYEKFLFCNQDTRFSFLFS